MSRYETLMARDGHTFSTYIAKPAGKARGGSIIVQEIFGLTDFICRTADRCAEDGYLTLAPALFDRIGRDLVLDYSPDDIEQGRGLSKQIDNAKAMLDIAAAAAVTRHVGKLAVIGFSWSRSCRRHPGVRPCCILALRTHRYRRARSSVYVWLSRAAPIICMRAPTMISATRIAPIATTLKPPHSRSSAARPSWRNTLARATATSM
jgi:hypothetical protein